MLIITLFRSLQGRRFVSLSLEPKRTKSVPILQMLTVCAGSGATSSSLLSVIPCTWCYCNPLEESGESLPDIGHAAGTDVQFYVSEDDDGI